uniref:Carboxymuconolactone decarboxylase-like domain-containing protein n=1 Tax=Streptoalloteichus sp. ATCC 53650 TaxID=756733 RepID=K4P0W8_9PSEU|nr:hypothetical protein [Streptoalloteichus sp. ATCC 53650]
MIGPLAGLPLRGVRHVTPVRPGAARGVVREVYRQVGRDFGMIAPPVALHSPAPAALAACWALLRETLIVGSADRAAKENAAAAVSAANSCPYCVEVHEAAALALGEGPDERLAAWARGGPAPFPAAWAAEFTGVAVAFHYLNRVANVFLDDSPLPPRMSDRARGWGLRVLGRVVRRTARRPRDVGTAGALLPAAPLPVDLAWAASAPHVADALARVAAAVERGGERSVPQGVREHVAARLSIWAGEPPPGPSRAWVEDEVADLPDADRPATRLALVTALASYQVDDAVVTAFRRHRPDDRSLVELVAWAGFTAARRSGALLAARPTAEHEPGRS